MEVVADTMVVVGGNGGEQIVQLYKPTSGYWIQLQKQTGVDLVGHAMTSMQQTDLFIRGGWFSRYESMKMEFSEFDEENGTFSDFKLTKIEDDLPERMFPIMTVLPYDFFN